MNNEFRWTPFHTTRDKSEITAKSVLEAMKITMPAADLTLSGAPDTIGAKAYWPHCFKGKVGGTAWSIVLVLLGLLSGWLSTTRTHGEAQATA